MREPLDQTDREICAALLRNGRATWRQIAQVTDMQERTVARRGARLLEQGVVQVRSLSPAHLSGRGINQFARIDCAPADLAGVASWLARRAESLWVATLTSASTVISELYLREDSRASFIEQELAGQPIQNYSFDYIGRYRRTVRGWHPNILTGEQLEQLGEIETSALEASNEERPGSETPVADEIDHEVVRLLSMDGRLRIDALASRMGIAKPTVRRRIAHLQRSDQLSIRAVIDPALLGFPLEANLTVDALPSQLDDISRVLAEDWRTRWAAEVPGASQVQALMTFESHVELHRTLRNVERRLSGTAQRITAHPLLTHYKRSDVLLAPAMNGGSEAGT